MSHETILQPKVAILASYHAERARHFVRAYYDFQAAGADIIHPHTEKLVNPVDDIDEFVLREGDDPNKRNHELQMGELRDMLTLKDGPRGQGFGYVVAEDRMLGMNTAAEMAWLRLHSIPVVASRNIEGFRKIPRHLQNTLRKIPSAILPLEEVNSDSLQTLMHDLRTGEYTHPTLAEKKELADIIRPALREQKFGSETFTHALVASKSPLKIAAVRQALISLYPNTRLDNPVLVDSVPAVAKGIPEQPFQHQGIAGARRRMSDALNKTVGYIYSGGVFAFENTVVRLNPENFDPEAWVTKDHWINSGMSGVFLDDAIYADVAIGIYLNQKRNTQVWGQSRPVVINSEVVKEWLKRGQHTLYAEVLRDMNPNSNVSLDDPHYFLSKGTYPRTTQLRDLAENLVVTSWAATSAK